MMKKGLISLIPLALLLWGQSVPPPVVIQGKVSPELQAKILKLQLQATRIQSQYQACQQTDFQAQYNQVSAAIQPVVDAAFHEAKLKREEWDLNLETFEFTRKIAVAPAEAKGEKKPN